VALSGWKAITVDLMLKKDLYGVYILVFCVYGIVRCSGSLPVVGSKSVSSIYTLKMESADSSKRWESSIRLHCYDLTLR